MEYFVSSVNKDELKNRWGLDDQRVEALYAEVSHQHAPRSVNGSALLKQFEGGARFHPFGCSALDGLLLGGMRQGQVVELYGDSGERKQLVSSSNDATVFCYKTLKKLSYGKLFLLYRHPGSGKTQFCLKACAQAAARGAHVVYIDTSNAFTSKRFLRLFSGIANRQVVRVIIGLNSMLQDD